MVKEAADLVFYLDKLKAAKLCAFCLWNGKKLAHPLNTCFLMKNRCLKCGAYGHGVINCFLKKLPTGICYKCGLPSRIESVIVHPEPFGTSCRGDNLVLLIISQAYFNKHALMKEVIGVNEEGFLTWLSRKPTGGDINNAGRLFIKLIEILLGNSSSIS